MGSTDDTYYTVGEPTTGDYREKGSKFLSYLFHVEDTDDVELALLEVKSQHPKARHFCYAYRFGIEGEPHRANDDGEPSGTAGRPILGQMLSHDVSDCFIVVVRYFGGTKLGASGLISAYKTAAHLSLEVAKREQVILGQDYRLSFDYGKMGHVMNVLKQLDLLITSKSFDATAEVFIRIRNSELPQKIIDLKAKLLNISAEQIDDKTEVPFCKIETT